LQGPDGGRPCKVGSRANTGRASAASPMSNAPLLRVCSLLNKHRVQYLIVGARAWKVSYTDAVGTSLKTTIDGVAIPYVDLKTLIKSKSTERDQDKVDVQRLQKLGEGTSI
jgi:hypothetical protein